MKRDLTLAGFDPLVTWNDRKAVHPGGFDWPGFCEAGLSPMRGCPSNWRSTQSSCRRLRRRVVTACDLLLQHYDLPSLMAGKLHAILARKYAKGRDWYDLVWYLSQRSPVEPNVELLQNALDQTHGDGKLDACLAKAGAGSVGIIRY
ncbi:MAG: nucleotidyl transferase AbiEii/AbiGii toxin family protein [Acidobacteria bacterium]|nr:nucleotidyl transferase AbiEii/AbiGii toxin family protein [Acidobacteriota bacterium]